MTNLIEADKLKDLKNYYGKVDLDIDLVARLYIQKLIDVHDPEFLASVNFSFEKVFQVMFDNHIRGIANAKGLEYYENQLASK